MADTCTGHDAGARSETHRSAAPPSVSLMVKVMSTAARDPQKLQARLPRQRYSSPEGSYFKREMIRARN
jgi:hypothetical protein